MIIPPYTYTPRAYKVVRNNRIFCFFLSLSVFTAAFLFSFFIFTYYAMAQFSPAEDMQAIKTYYEEEEAQALLINDSYTNIPRIDYGTEIVEVHYYDTPGGLSGFQIILYKDNIIYSEGYGPEAQDRTYQLILDKNYGDIEKSIY